MGSRGRSSPAYLAAARRFRTGQHPCEIRSPRCTGAGTTVDHDPPLSDFASPEQWRGRLRPACPACQGWQAARITNAKRGNRVQPAPDWSW